MDHRRAQSDHQAAAHQGRAEPPRAPDRDELLASGADGVNLDFEPLPSEVRSQFTSFVRQLRRTLERATTAAGLPSMQVTFDITADVAAYDVPALTADDAADAVFLMAYDFRNGSAEYAASLSPLDDPETGFDIRTTVEALLGVVDPAYAILGLPWYGRAWTTRGRSPSPTRSGSRYTPASTWWYEDAVAIARANGRNYDPVAQTAWTVYVVKRPGATPAPRPAPGVVRRCRWLRRQVRVRAGGGCAAWACGRWATPVPTTACGTSSACARA
ncbi:MAG: glycosyl hydrolase family 18 protein [Chloroflexota bacterium]